MAEQNSIALGDEIFVLNEEGEARTGILVGTNAETVNEKLLYTVKLENKFWVGPEGRVFPQGTAIEAAMAAIQEIEDELTEKINAQMAQREDEERRRVAALEELAAAEAAEEEGEGAAEEPTE